MPKVFTSSFLCKPAILTSPPRKRFRKSYKQFKH